MHSDREVNGRLIRRKRDRRRQRGLNGSRHHMARQPDFIPRMGFEGILGQGVTKPGDLGVYPENAIW